MRALVELRRCGRARRELEAVVADQALDAPRETPRRPSRTRLQRLLQAAGYRDDNTHEHTQRVAALAARLARGLGLGRRARWR